MIVMKFGGSSVGDAQRIKDVCQIIEMNRDKHPVVVVSAVAGITDLLIEAAAEAQQGNNVSSRIVRKHMQLLKELDLPEELLSEELTELDKVLSGITLLKEVTPRTTDYIVSFGERMSAKIVAESCKQNGIESRAINAYDVGIVTNNNYGDAEILPRSYENLRRSISLLPDTLIPILTGFIAKDEQGEITTLGRGGSDYTAAVVGSAIGADEIQIWTDVDGMMTCDPKIVKQARTIDVISFDEAAELAYFGAKILHPKTLIPAINANVPVRILNTYNPEGTGTTVVQNVRTKGGVTAIAAKKDLSVINIHSERMLFAYGFLNKVFKVFSDHQVPVDMISTSEVNISLTVSGQYDLTDLLESLRQFVEVKLEKHKASICVVGAGIKHTPKIAGRIFSRMADNNINVEMITQGASEINVGFVISESDVDKAIVNLHECFFSEGEQNETGRMLHSDGDALQSGQDN